MWSTQYFRKPFEDEPRRHGAYWNKREVRDLMRAVELEIDMKRVAEKHQRSEFAVWSRLSFVLDKVPDNAPEHWRPALRDNLVSTHRDSQGRPRLGIDNGQSFFTL